jgi:periplasmic protein CpxP/Spy
MPPDAFIGVLTKVRNHRRGERLHPQSMKQTILLSMAVVVGAAAIAISQPTASDPTSAVTPAPGASSSTSASEQAATTSAPATSTETKVSATSSDPQKTCGYEGIEGSRGKSRGHGNWRDRHHSDRFMEKKLDRLLNLTDEQREKVREILQASKPKIKAIREEQWAKMRAVKEENRQEIRALLNPAQQKVFDEAQQVREQAWKLKQESRKLHQEADDQS